MFECCIQRPPPEEEEEDLPPIDRGITINKLVDKKGGQGKRFTLKESLDLEWSIVARSVDPDELERVHSLRACVQDLDSHPACRERPLSQQAQTLLRFLRGREGDVKAAEKMFRDSMNWRVSMDLDAKVAAWNAELKEGTSRRAQIVKRYGTDAEICLDNFGVPVWLMRMSVSDPAGVLRELGQEALLIHSLANMEWMHAALRSAMFENGKVVKGCIQIFDVGDYGRHGVPNWWSRMWDGFRVGSVAFKLFDLNYPETTRKVFILRMGVVSHNIHRLATPLIPRRTKVKMRLFGYYAASWLEELRAEVPHGTKLPAFITSDSESAFASARPRGGLVPEDTGVERLACSNGVANNPVSKHTRRSLLVGVGNQRLFFCSLILAAAAIAFALQDSRFRHDFRMSSLR